MKIQVNMDLCTGHGRCYTLSPEVFAADEDGYCATPDGTIAPELEDAARRGALNCPEDAITLVD